MIKKKEIINYTWFWNLINKCMKTCSAEIRYLYVQVTMTGFLKKCKLVMKLSKCELVSLKSKIWRWRIDKRWNRKRKTIMSLCCLFLFRPVGISFISYIKTVSSFCLQYILWLGLKAQTCFFIQLKLTKEKQLFNKLLLIEMFMLLNHKSSRKKCLSGKLSKKMMKTW
jgi:hypothetical protein